MGKQASRSEYLVISRGQWDKDISKEEIQKAIDDFYVWLARLIEEQGGTSAPHSRTQAN